MLFVVIRSEGEYQYNIGNLSGDDDFGVYSAGFDPDLYARSYRKEGCAGKQLFHRCNLDNWRKAIAVKCEEESLFKLWIGF